MNKPYLWRDKSISKFHARLIVIWLCIKYLFQERKMPSKALWRWVSNSPTEKDVKAAQNRLTKNQLRVLKESALELYR